MSNTYKTKAIKMCEAILAKLKSDPHYDTVDMENEVAELLWKHKVKWMDEDSDFFLWGQNATTEERMHGMIDMLKNGRITKFLPPVYYTEFTLKGNGKRKYNIFQSHTDAQLKQAAKKLFPDMTKDEHARYAKNTAQYLSDREHEYYALVGKAFKDKFGREIEPQDYKVSGIVRDEFDEETKQKLRDFTRQISEYTARERLHAAAAGKAAMDKAPLPPSAMKKSKSNGKFIVVRTGDDESAWWLDDNQKVPHTFDSIEEAEAEIKTHLEDVAEAVSEGHMDADTQDTRDDFDIITYEEQLAKGGTTRDSHKYYLNGFIFKDDYDNRKSVKGSRKKALEDNNQDTFDWERAEKLQQEFTKGFYAVGIFAVKDNREVSIIFSADRPKQEIKFVKAKKLNGEQYYTIGEDDGEKPLYNEQEKKLVQDGFHIELELRASRNPKDKIEAYLKNMQKRFPDATLVFSDNELGAYWRIYVKSNQTDATTKKLGKGGSTVMLRHGMFTIDDTTSYPGYYNPTERWNGWFCPMFELPAVEKIIADFTHGMKGKIDSNGIVIITDPAYPKEPSVYEPSVIDTPDGQKTIYDIGSHDWAWDMDEPEDEMEKGGTAKVKKMYLYFVDPTLVTDVRAYVPNVEYSCLFLTDSKFTAQSYKRAVEIYYPNLDKLKSILEGMTQDQVDDFAKKVFTWYPDLSISKEELINDDIMPTVERDSREGYTDRQHYIEKAVDAIKSITGQMLVPFKDIGTIIECEVNMSNPLVFDADKADDISSYDIQGLIAQAKKEGHDGVLIKDGNCNAMFTDKGEDLVSSNCAIPFSVDQVEVIDGSNNNIYMPDGFEEYAKGGTTSPAPTPRSGYGNDLVNYFLGQ